MKSKILLQILLFLFASIILFFTFYNYSTDTIDISSNSDLIQNESKIDKTYEALQIKFTNSQLGTEASVEEIQNMVENLTQ